MLETNKIYLGDAYELIKKIPDKSIDLVYTDIPYSFSGNGLVKGGGCFGTEKRDYHKEYEKVSINTEKTSLYLRKTKQQAEMQNISYGIDFKILDEFVRVLKNIYIYIWCSKEQILPLMKYFIEEKHCFHEILVWCKTNPIPACNNKYLSDLEYCLMFREKGTKLNGSYETKSKFYVSGLNVEDKGKFLHPTCKPVDLIEKHLKNSTNENDIVLDTFLGSGSTAIACKHLNRKYIGFEIDENYYKIATDRLNGINQKGEMNLFDI